MHEKWCKRTKYTSLGFYYHLGFKEVGRDEYDGEGKGYPILHLEKS